MNRIDRISAILIQLQSRKVVKAGDIAKRFGISVRTVYRDVRTLEIAGVPIIGEAGTGYSIMEGYRLPPVMFTLEEAMALHSAEKMVGTLTDRGNSEHYKTAMYKVKAVLRSNEKDFLERMDDHLEVVKAPRQPSLGPALHPLQTILKATADKAILSLTYVTAHGGIQSVRLVEPVGAFYLDNYWHLIGWCRTRQDYRDFRFDRIMELRPTGEKFSKTHPDLKTYLETTAQAKKLVPVTLWVKKPANSHFTDQKHYHGFVSETPAAAPGWLTMEFLTLSMEGFARWYLMFGDQSRIIRPETLKTRVRELLADLLKKV